jgi:hypothetical protein
MLQHRFIMKYTAFCNLLPNQKKNPVELRLICRESADRTTFSTSNFPMAQMIHVGPQCGLLARSALGS